MSANSLPQVTIIDSGSTNRPGLRVTVDASGHAEVAGRTGENRRVKLDADACKRFLEEVQSTPLDSLPARHCAKSVSFGSRLTIEFRGVESPDISCSGQDDPHVQTLQKAAQELLGAARANSGIRNSRVIR